jgi:hypothetical protein
MQQAGRRPLEIVTAVALALAGAVVSAESMTHDIGWNANGPGPGYFPFRIGLLLVAAAFVLAVQGLGVARDDLFVTREALRRSLSVFLPTLVLVAAMFVLGCYVPSALYLAWMMRRHGGYRWITAVASGAAIMGVFFLVFDLWFRVPLAKGPIEAALGIY